MSEQSEQRAHAVLSASGVKKWASCPASAAFEDWVPEEDSTFSREGTYAHALGEAMLRAWLEPSPAHDAAVAELRDTQECEEAAEFWTEELEAAVLTYVEYVKERVEQRRAEDPQAQVLLETRVDFSTWVPEGFGRCDVTIVGTGFVEVIDLKAGAGVRVDGRENWQLRLYALGAAAMFGAVFDFERIKTAIVQPRMDNITGESITVDELLDWAETVIVPRAQLAWDAYATRQRFETRGSYSQRAIRVALRDAGVAFAPGEHCVSGFCKIRHTCNARAKYMLDAAQVPWALDEPSSLTTEQLESVVDGARAAVRWLSGCESYLLAQAASGRVKLATHEVVESRTQRVIRDHAGAAQALMANGFAASDIYSSPTLKGVTVLQKLVGKAKFEEIMERFIGRTQGFPKLAPLDSGEAPYAPQPDTTKTQSADDAFGSLD